MKRYKHTIVMILLVIIALIAGYGFICFMVEAYFPFAPDALYQLRIGRAVEKEV